MELFSVHLHFLRKIAHSTPTPHIHELAVHVVYADDEEMARQKGNAIGSSCEKEYTSVANCLVQDVFVGVVEIQPIYDGELKDGIEVASWIWSGDEKPDLTRNWE